MTRPQDLLAQPLTLRCGAVLPNRLAKSAMSEALGTIDNRVTPALVCLYERWARGGIGLCITGNVMIDRRALGEPGNVALEDDRDAELLQAWAQAGTVAGGQLWMQLNHPGKQAPKGLNAETVAPSAVPFSASLARFFDVPRELTDAEIRDIIARFGKSAQLAEQAGFGGVQIHGAHGYLVSQFLSPKQNLRTDEWGGDAQRRRHFVLEVYRAIRRATQPGFGVGIKLNSADFQRGGFTEAESLDVLRALSDEGIDLLEISGGTYEAPAMATGVRDSTRQREAYFLEFADKARAVTKVPLMVTGGFRSLHGMADALQAGSLDLVGLARPLAVEPDLPLRLLAGKDPQHAVPDKIATGIKALDKAALMEVAWYARQLRRMGRGDEPEPDEPALMAFLGTVLESGWKTWQTRRLRA